MKTEPVDPRDVTWEDTHPAYRVYFWSLVDGPVEVPTEHLGFKCREYRVLDAPDVHDVIAWAKETAQPDETYTLYIERWSADGLGVIRLAGTDRTTH